MPTSDPQHAGLDLDRVHSLFEESTDFTVGLEEEFALLDPESLELEHRFAELFEACMRDEVLAGSAKGELIDTEIEIRSGRGETFAEAMAMQRERRARLFALAQSMGIALGATGTHPWASYLDQRIIDTQHYQRLRDDLRWVAQRNNSWSLHVHVGVRGADRAIAVTDRMRELLPALLAMSANSPFLDGHDTGLHSVRTEIFTRVFPRCGIHEPFGDWSEYARFVELLARTGSIVEGIQLWWSVRPHHSFGTVEVRICDAQSRGEESFSLAALMAACVAQTALDYDELGPERTAPLRQREIEENLWRAIRYGLDGEMIDFRRGGRVIPTRQAIEGLLEWCEPARRELGLEVAVPEANGAQRARRMLAEGASIADAYGASVAETGRTYVPERVPGG
jgi:carboxylate-amine ligase